MWFRKNIIKLDLVPIDDLYGISLKCLDEPIHFILDSGCARDIIDTGFIKRHPEITTRWEIGGIATLKGKSTKTQVADLQIEGPHGSWYSNTFSIENVNKALPDDIQIGGLLGTPFLECCKIDFSKKILTWDCQYPW